MSHIDGGPPVLGIDLGGTKILVAVISAENEVLGRAKRPTPAQEGGDAIARTILACVDDALAAAQLSRHDIAAAGVGSPGPLDSETGTILFSANLNVRNFALGPMLARELQHPVLVENDVRVGGYGEFRLGAGRGARSLIAVFVGTGIGGCLVERGQVVDGFTHNAGEIGHLIVKPGGPKCGCGNRGCMEALASRTAITRRVAKAVRKGVQTVLAEKIGRKSGRLKSGEVADAFLADDRVVVHEVHRAAHFLGLGLGGLINVFGPELIVVGGGLTEAIGDRFVDLVRSSARVQAITDPTAKVRFERSSLGDDSGILGAALLAREKFLVPETVEA